MHIRSKYSLGHFAAAGITLVACGTAAAAPLPGEFGGGALTLSLETSGPGIAAGAHGAAQAGCPCRGTNGQLRVQTTSQITIPGVAMATTSQAAAEAGKTAHAAQMQDTATLTHLNLLGGLITADALTASAGVSATASALGTSEAGTTLTNLVVGGQAIAPDVPDNTSLPLAGIGTVTVKATEAHVGKQNARLRVDALLVEVTQSNPLLPVGAKLVVGRAEASFKRAQPPAALGGAATAAHLYADAGSPLQTMVGAGSGVGIPDCAGTGGQTETKSVTNTSVPGVLSLSTATETAFGGPQGSASVAETTSTLSNVSLLGGLIAADTVVAVAQVSRTGNVSTPSATGSQIANLRIAGLPVPLTMPNQKLSVPGVGYVVANEQIAHGTTAFTTNGLHLVITSSLIPGLPAGANLVVAHAEASARKF